MGKSVCSLSYLCKSLLSLYVVLPSLKLLHCITFCLNLLNLCIRVDNITSAIVNVSVCRAGELITQSWTGMLGFLEFLQHMFLCQCSCL